MREKIRLLVIESIVDSTKLTEVIDNLYYLTWDYSKITNIVFDGVNKSDYPDYSDAFICSAEYEGKPLTESQLDMLNEDSELVYELLTNNLH